MAQVAKTVLIGAIALFSSFSAFAQSTYPTAQGTPPVLVPGAAILVPIGTDSGGRTIYGPPSASFPLQTTVKFSTVAPAAATTATITTGGTAVTLVSGPINGGYVVNPANATSQGIVTAENAYIDPVATPGSTDAAANGTTAALSAGQVYVMPPLATGAVLKANAGTSGHKLTVVVW